MPPKSVMVEPGQDPLKVISQYRRGRGFLGFGLSLSTVAYIGLAIVVAFCLWWQFGRRPKPAAAAQPPAPTSQPASATPSPFPSPTASPSASPSPVASLPWD